MKVYQSESIKDLAESLSKAQGEIKHAAKAVNNQFYKSKYADLPAVIDAAKEALAKCGLSVIQYTDIAENGDTVLITQLCHMSGQWVRGWYPVKPIKNDPQGLGSAVTYARRYAFCAITGVAAAEDDDDGNAASDISSNAKKESAASKRRKFEAFKKALLEAKSPTQVWLANPDEVADFANDPEPELAMSSLLKLVVPNIEKIILEGKDPGEAWQAELPLITLLTKLNMKAEFDLLVAAGKKRRESIAQDSLMVSGMTEGFNGVHA
jgi:hypothetical protein